MRVLLAIDGSAAAESARRLARSLPWPDGTIITVLGVVEPTHDVFAARRQDVSSAPVAAREHALGEALGGAAAALEAPGRIVRRVLVEGRPASVIVNQAADIRAELVIIGSRGLGPLKSMVLGSVSAEVVDHAPCPVLVVRPGRVDRILLAVDGSPSANAAVAYLAGHRFLATLPVEVLAVAGSPAPPMPIPAAGISDDAFQAYDATIREHREWAEATAAKATQTLRGIGIASRWSISQGDPAHEIIEAARDLATGLVVLGSRGHTGLARVLLGSVARNVLLHSEASVLIVREPLRVRSPRRKAPGAIALEVGRRGRATPAVNPAG